MTNSFSESFLRVNLLIIGAMIDETTAIYIHVPFCRVRCTYCDFVTYAGKGRLIPDYFAAIRRELELHAPFVTGTIPSIYFGGGTPSFAPVEEIAGVTDLIRHRFSVSPDAEVTFEMNPCDVTKEKAEGLYACGINRISLGMQSAIPEELKAMGRKHDHEQTARAVELLRSAGFGNISLDLIYGYPGQTPASWQRSLESALALGPQHLSMYALQVEEGSILERLVSAGKVSLPSDDLTVDLYEQGNAFLKDHGFEHYEISNWAAAPEYESRHNRQYWLDLPYVGIGAGAHGCGENGRTENTDSIEDYISRMNGAGDRFAAAETVVPRTERVKMQDTMMLGLRLLNDGITPERFRNRFGKDFEEVFARELRHLRRKELILPGETVRLNEKHVPVANQAFMEFVD